MKYYYRRQRQKKLLLALVALILVMLLFIPARLAIAYYQAPQPQAILVLGGGENREEFAAQIAEFYPALKIWVSSGIPPNKSHAIFKAAGIADKRVYLDYRATDTVTNFTTLVRVFQQLHIQHLFLITSDFHMPRAKAIATIILGSQGIAFTPISVASNTPPESQIRIMRDCVRALLWIFTG
ncbi:YdcF family protein [uncultured Nostoc sp.]|uniref:YdcF family protein n=1 Tax=uncultured Nostoc sp. TaxID=340711 RepID=UPI0035CA6F0F